MRARRINMITLLCVTLIIATLIAAIKIILWLTKMWLKLSVGIIEVIIIIACIAMLL